MIFVTVGTQLPFDRLILAVDAWASTHPSVEVVAQTGPTENSPKNIIHMPFLPPDQAEANFLKASLIVSHAGMGSILTALRYKKPILIMPRRADLNEHRNDHQVATAKRFCEKPGVTVAWQESEIAAALDRRDALPTGDGISEFANPALLSRLQSYLNSI